MEIMVSYNRDEMRRMLTGESERTLGGLLTGVPTLEVISPLKDTSVSALVQLDEAQFDALKARVENVCDLKIPRNLKTY